jgi:hypothetical protein
MLIGFKTQVRLSPSVRHKAMLVLTDPTSTQTDTEYLAPPEDYKQGQDSTTALLPSFFKGLSL